MLCDMSEERAWWETTTVYQVYPRSFADIDGDGIGDLPGVIDRLDHLADLGVGTLWVSPFFASPQRDIGYDISDYRDVAPEYGTIDDAERLIERSARAGPAGRLRPRAQPHLRRAPVVRRVTAFARQPRGRLVRLGRRTEGGHRRRGGRPTAPRTTGDPGSSRCEARGSGARSGGQWYLATFLPCQPDLNWHNPEVEAEMFDTIRFWLERGRGRLPARHLPRDHEGRGARSNPVPSRTRRLRGCPGSDDPINTANTEDNFALARDLRAVCDEFDPERILLGEVFGPAAVLRRYSAATTEGIETGCTWCSSSTSWPTGSPPRGFATGSRRFERDFPPPQMPTYVLENHDRSRSASRVGGDLRKARALAVMLLTLRGVPTVYMGQEVGMTNTYLPLSHARDPIVDHYFSWVPEWLARRLPERINRDEMRTPMQWDGSPTAGFCPPGVAPWLPPNDDRADRNVADQTGDPTSLLELYRSLLTLRRDHAALHAGRLELVDGLSDDVLGYRRIDGDERVLVVVNFGEKPARVHLGEPGAVVSLASAAGARIDGVWLDVPAVCGVVAGLAEAPAELTPRR